MKTARTLAVTVALLAGGAAAVAAQVTVHRDPWGVPHIVADTEEAGFYGLGYAQAEDQLEFILNMFLAGRGELAAAFGDGTTSGFGGPPTANAVATDSQSRMWRHVEEAQAGWGRLSPQLQQNYVHYVAGMEAWMAEHPDRTPDWAPDLEPWDPVVLSRFVLWPGYQAGQGLQDCARGGVQLAAAERDALARADQKRLQRVDPGSLAHPRQRHDRAERPARWDRRRVHLRVAHARGRSARGGLLARPHADSHAHPRRVPGG